MQMEFSFIAFNEKIKLYTEASYCVVGRLTCLLLLKLELKSNSVIFDTDGYLGDHRYPINS